MGGIEPALRIVLDSLAAGKHVVTANKALLAEHGPRDLRPGRAATAAPWRSRRASAGGIPIVQALGRRPGGQPDPEPRGDPQRHLQLHPDQDDARGAALRRRPRRRPRQLGYAEADPTLDVDGTDTAHKLAILAQLAFEASVTTADIPRQGIDRLQLADITYAGELGYAVKLLALAKLSAAGLELRVAPTLVRRGTPAGRGARPVQRDPRRRRRRRRHLLLRPGRGDDAHGVGRGRRPDRRGRSAGRP